MSQEIPEKVTFQVTGIILLTGRYAQARSLLLRSYPTDPLVQTP